MREEINHKNHTKYIQIAIDGPGGSGKSTIARAVARKLNFTYIDTGAMYRAITLHCLKLCVDINNEVAITKAIKSANIELTYTDGHQNIFLNNINVTESIRSLPVSQATSIVATFGYVRKRLVKMQQQMAQGLNIVMDGRDIGTVVLPNATLKIFLTANPDIRAERRRMELIKSSHTNIPSLSQIKNEIKERDERDFNRTISPTRQASNSILIDTSFMTIEEVRNKIISLIKEA